MSKSNVDRKKVQRWLSLLTQNNSLKLNVLITALEDCNYDELNLLYKKVPTILRGLMSLSFLKRRDYASIFKNTSVRPAKDVAGYIGLMVYILTKHANDINKYVKLKEKLDRLALKGAYDDAKRVINEINTTIGYSYWAAIYEIKIERLHKGLDACTSLYNKLYKENNSIARYYYYCAYRSSSLDFPSDKMMQILLPQDEKDSEYINNVLISHCLPYMYFEDGEWICADINSSVIDLYNNFINYLPNLKLETKSNPDVLNYILDLNCCIKDAYLNKLSTLYGVIEASDLQDKRQNLWSAYTEGSYKEFIDLAKPYIDERPEDLEILGLYLKSLIVIGSNEVSFNKEGSIIDRVCYHYYELLLHKTNSSLHRRKLMDICKSQFHIYGLRCLYTMISDLATNNIKDIYNNSWKYSQYNSPTDCAYYGEYEARKEYVQKLGYKTKFWEKVFDANQKSLSLDCYEMSLAIQDTDFTFRYVNDLFVRDCVPPFYQDTLSTYVFNHFINAQQYKEAVVFYVTEKLKNAQLNITFDNVETVHDLVNNSALNDEIPLEIMIFYHLANFDLDTIYLAYKKYLRYRHVKKASELIVDGCEKTRYFLSQIAVPSIITRHVLQFKSVIQVLMERIQICSNLYEFYNQKEYNDEISSLYRDIKIHELNNQVDESKIYVDVKAIKDHEIDEVRVMYDMYENASSNVSYYDASSLGGILTKLMEMGMKVQALDKDLNIYSLQMNSNTEEKEQTSYRKNILSQIFIEIRNQFLFNPKYGLDNYLSTRIRHGTLINKLRNHFEENYLVTNVVNGDYGHNQYWIDSKFKLRDKSALQCLMLFNEFSTQVDLVIAELKNEYIQCSTELVQGKTHACFNYDISSFEVYINEMLINKDINSFESCYDEIIDYLWVHTDRCLENMRHELAKAQIKLIDALHNLEKDVNSIAGENAKLSDFNDAVSHCQNGIQTDVQTVSKWFKRRNNVAFDFTISQVIDTCKLSMKRGNCDKVDILVNCSVNTELQGTYFGTLYDIFNDVLNNVQDYEKKYHVGGQCVINVNVEGDYLLINVSNPILTSHEEELKEKVKTINLNLKSLLHSGKSRDEGNSGCSKIFNAIHNHLASPNNEYVNSVHDSMFIVDVKIELEPLMKVKHENINS